MMNTDLDSWSASLQNDLGLRLGLLLLAEVAVVSFIGPTILLAITIRHAIKNYRLHGGWGLEDSSLQPVSLLFLVAIFMDSMQAMAGILAARWAFNGKVTEGSYCTTQAVIQQIGNDGVSWFTIAIAVMTFLQTMFPGKLSQSQARWLAVAMIASIFLFLALIIIIPATTIPHYYGNTGPWCWVTNRTLESSRLKIGSEYAYFWLAAVVTFVLYGIIVVNWLREATAKRDRRLLREAISMGWYPIAYIVEIFPVSLVRFLQWRPKGPEPRHGFIIAADLLFAASGAVNVLLWFLTGRRFGFSDPPGDKEEEDHERGSYPVGRLAPVAEGIQFPAAVAPGGESCFSHPSFPDEALMSRAVCVPEPYEWAPPQEGELGP